MNLLSTAFFPHLWATMVFYRALFRQLKWDFRNHIQFPCNRHLFGCNENAHANFYEYLLFYTNYACPRVASKSGFVFSNYWLRETKASKKIFLLFLYRSRKKNFFCPPKRKIFQVCEHIRICITTESNILHFTSNQQQKTQKT